MVMEKNSSYVSPTCETVPMLPVEVMAALALLAVACVPDPEITSEEQVPPGPVILSATIEDNTETKANVAEDSGVVTFSAGDKISIRNGSNTREGTTTLGGATADGGVVGSGLTDASYSIVVTKVPKAEAAQGEYVYITLPIP